MQAADRVARWPIVVKSMVTVETMLSQLRRYKRRGVPCGPGQTSPLAVVVIDYIQRIPHDAKSEVEGLTNAMHQLQRGMLALDIPAVVLSQPSTDSRRSGQAASTTGAHAKGSGAIEEDCDLFAVLERGGENRTQAGLRVTKTRDMDGALPHWPAVDVAAPKSGVALKACGWRGPGPGIVVPSL